MESTHEEDRQINRSFITIREKGVTKLISYSYTQYVLRWAASEEF